MIGLDTNVLVRYVMQDDPKQAPKATKIIESLTGMRDKPRRSGRGRKARTPQAS